MGDGREFILLLQTEIESGRKEEAHQAPICRLSYSEERNEMGSVALENVAKVWDVSRPTDSRIRFQLETPGEISQVTVISYPVLHMSEYSPPLDPLDCCSH